MAARRWRAAEAQLYPLIVADPDLYQAAVELVVQARGVLRDQCATVADLLAARADDVLAGCPSAAAVRAQGFDPQVAFAAACAQRQRELHDQVPSPTRDSRRP